MAKKYRHPNAPPELVDVTAILLQETDKALFLDDGRIRTWVPKSFVEDNRDGTFTMPEWMAYQKGFI